MRFPRRSCTFLIAEDAFPHSLELIEELRARYELRIVRCPSGAFIRHRTLLLRELAMVLRLLAFPHVYRRGDLIVSSSGQYAALLVASVLAGLGRNPTVFLFNFYLHRLGQKTFVKRILAWL